MAFNAGDLQVAHAARVALVHLHTRLAPELSERASDVHTTFIRCLPCLAPVCSFA